MRHESFSCGVTLILGVCHPLKIACSVVFGIAVFVINLRLVLGVWHKQFCDKAVNPNPNILSVFRLNEKAQIALASVIHVQTKNLASIATCAIRLLRNVVNASGAATIAYLVGGMMRNLRPLFFLHVVMFGLSACSTVTPSAVKSQEASYDQNQQNSGVISQNANGYVVTSHFHDRWMALVKTYGRDYKPAIDAKAGWLDLGDGTWLVDKQRMVAFLEMNGWLRAGLKPSNP